MRPRQDFIAMFRKRKGTLPCSCFDDDCALCGFGLEIFVPPRSMEGLSLSPAEVSLMRQKLLDDTPDSESDGEEDESSSAGTKRKWGGDAAQEPLRKASTTTPTQRPLVGESNAPKTRISLDFAAIRAPPDAHALTKPLIDAPVVSPPPSLA